MDHSTPTSTSDKSDKSQDSLRSFLTAAFEACDGAGVILNNYFGNLRNIDEKFQAGLVSEADRDSENYIVQLLRSRFPGHDILGEESGLSAAPTDEEFGSIDQGSRGADERTRRSGALWMIDPLDGTTNYVHQFPFFCISIGLEIDGELVVGVVDAPKLGLRYHAVRGQGAFLNGERIHVSSRTEFRDGLFATGFSNYDNSLDEQLELLTLIIRQARGIRRAGAAALDLCFVAQGVFDVFWEKNLQPWDTAAGTLIAREAGAIATTMDGEPFEPRRASILCGSPAFHAEVLGILNEIRGRSVK